MSYSYIDRNLLPGETVTYRARQHRIIWTLPVVTFAATIWAFNAEHPICGIVLLFFAIMFTFYTWFERMQWEAAVTNRRVIGRSGMTAIKQIDVMLSRVETVSVEQTDFPLMRGFGTVTVIGTGGTQSVFASVIDPAAFRAAIYRQMEAAKP